MTGIDWALFALYFAGVLSFALYQSRKNEGMEGYFLANRRLPWWAIGLSVMATQASAITFIGTTGQAFDDGMEFVQFYLALPFAMIILCAVFVPIFYRARVFTAYEYLERRFDANVILWGSEGKPDDWGSNEAGAYVDLRDVDGRVERVDQNHVKYFLDLNPGEKRFVRYSVTYKRRKVGPELNTEKKREPL